MILIHAYDDSGNRRPRFRLEDGDIIEWKRDGQTGFCLGRVTAHADKDIGGGLRRCPVRIMPLDRDRNPVGTRDRWIGRTSIMHVYERDGRTRKQPRPEDQTTGH